MWTILLLWLVSFVNSQTVQISGTGGYVRPFMQITRNYTPIDATKIMSIRLVTQINDPFTNAQGKNVVCWTTEVDEATASSALKNNCFVYDVYCTTGSWTTTSGYTTVLRSATISSGTVTTGATLTRASNFMMDSGRYYYDEFQFTAAEIKSLGIPEVASPNYKVDRKCYSKDFSSGYSTTTSFCNITRS